VTVTRQGAEVELRVHDDGIKMAPEIIPRVFDLFTQADRSLARSEGGLGIGPTIVRNLVELHGGTVTAASEGPGRGSEFVVRLRSAGVGDARAAVPAKDATSVRRLRILVVEDNSDGREMLRAMLEVDRHEVYVAADGPGGLETARAIRPDAAVIDIGLPGLDGYEVGQRMRGAQDNNTALCTRRPTPLLRGRPMARLACAGLLPSHLRFPAGDGRRRPADSRSWAAGGPSR
jgi:hypothetical protein